MQLTSGRVDIQNIQTRFHFEREMFLDYSLNSRHKSNHKQSNHTDLKQKKGF